MKLLLTAATAAAILAFTALAAPTDIKYDAPPGGWESIDYPDDTGENLHEYPAPPGGWENVDYPKGAGENLPYYPPPKDDGKDDCKPSTFPFVFTSTYSVVAKGSEVRNGTTPAPGPEDAVGFFNFGINSMEDTICYVRPYPLLPSDLPNPSTTNPITEYHTPQRLRDLPIARQNRHTYPPSRARSKWTS